MKRVFCLVLSAALVLLSAGCGAGVQPSGEEPTPQRVTLTLMLPQTHYKDFLQEAIGKFEAEHPQIRIDPQIIPDNQWLELVKRKVAVGETPDLIRIDRGLILDVGTEHFVAFGQEEPWYGRVLPDQLASKLIGGQLYGLPVGANSAIIIAYNRALFEQYRVKVPESMEELWEACRTFREAGVIPLYASDKDSWTAAMGFNAAAPQAVSQQTFDALLSGQLRWSQVPEFVDILNEFAAFRFAGCTNADFLNGTYASAVASMAGGNTAMYITGHFFINDVRKQNPDLDIMAAAVPYAGDLLTVIPGQGQISLFRNSPHQQEAKIFLDWFSQPENMDIFNAGWGHTAVFSDQSLQLPDWQQTLADAYISQGKTVLQLDDILSGFDRNDLWGYQQEMLAGLLTAEEVLEKWDASFAAQLKAKQVH